MLHGGGAQRDHDDARGRQRGLRLRPRQVGERQAAGRPESLRERQPRRHDDRHDRTPRSLAACTASSSSDAPAFAADGPAGAGRGRGMYTEGPHVGLERGAISRSVVTPAGLGPARAGAVAADGRRTGAGPRLRNRAAHGGASAPPAGRPRRRRGSVRRDDRVGRDVVERARAARRGGPGRRRRAAVPARLRRGVQRRDLPLDPRSRRALPLDRHGAQARRPAGRAMRRRRQPGACCAPGPIGSGARLRSRSISRAGPSRGTTRTSSRRSEGCRRRASSTSTSGSKTRRRRSTARTTFRDFVATVCVRPHLDQLPSAERQIVPRRADDGGGGGLARLHARLLAAEHRRETARMTPADWYQSRLVEWTAQPGRDGRPRRACCRARG